MLNVYCVKWGTKYDRSFVEKLNAHNIDFIGPLPRSCNGNHCMMIGFFDENGQVYQSERITVLA